MIDVPLMHSEIELLLEALRRAGLTGWPDGDDRVKVNVLRQQMEKKLDEVKARGWRGGRP